MFGLSLLATALIAAGAGLVLGWFVLPEPAFIRRFWIRLGFADRVN